MGQAQCLEMCGIDSQRPHRQTSLLPVHEEEDLPPVNTMIISDRVERWEKSYPFYRMSLYTMHSKLDEIGSSTFEPRSLEVLLDTPAWRNCF